MEEHTQQPHEEAHPADITSEEGDDICSPPVESGSLTISAHEEEDIDPNKDEEGNKTLAGTKEPSLSEDRGGDDVKVDSVIEGAANKCNLSVLNVKSILHHVLKDKRVLAFVQRQAAEEEGKNLDQVWGDDEMVTYEPKLTRSRVRQAVASGVASGTLHPEKVVSLTKSIPSKSLKQKQVSHHIFDDSLTNSESSDEEYDPMATVLEEESEEESEIEERVESDEDEDETFIESGATMDTDIGDETPLSDKSKVPSDNPQPFVSSPANSCLDLHKTPSATRHPSHPNTADSITPPTEHNALSSQSPTPLQQPLSPPKSSATPATTSVVQLPVTPTKDDASDLASNEALVRETAALLASLSDVILSPSKPMNILSSLQAANTTYHEPPVVHSNQNMMQVNVTEEDEIAKRTRSKFPLTDTPITVIEASFIPPDAEDPPIPMEVDQEEAEWQQWLSDLLIPAAGESTSHTDSEKAVSGLEDGEDNEDTEYNYLADHQEEEKEEFRNDRAVKISKKEVDELLSELLNPDAVGIGGLFSGDEMDLTSAYLLESLGLQPPSLFQASQTSAPLKHQQQGNESLTTNFVTKTTEGQAEGDHLTSTSGEEAPVGCYLSKEQTSQLWDQIQQHYQLLMQTFVLSRYEPSLVFLSQIAAQAVEEINKWCGEAKNGQNSAIWNVPDIEDGIQLIKNLDPNNENAVELVAASTSNPPRVPDVVQDLIMNSPLFWKYPKLLPAIGFAPHVKTATSGTKYFTSGEDELLVLGMHHYGPLAWKEIQENVMPTKTTKQLQLRVKNQCSKRTGDNVIKHFKKTKEIKIPFKDEEQEKYTDLPQWMMAYHKRRTDKEKQQERIEEKQRTLDIIRKPSSKLVPLCPKATTSVAMPLKSVITSGGSRRNLLTQLDSSSQSKRACVESSSPTIACSNKKRVPTRKTKHKKKNTIKTSTLSDTTNLSTNSNPQSLYSPPTFNTRKTFARSDMEHLLFAAGLEVSDPSARFASHYLNEVKATLALAGDKQELYTQFIETLLTAQKQQWSPCEIYREVKSLLNPWPYLVHLFTEFLRPEECVEANALTEKYELDSVKDFVQLLQDKFQKYPLELEEVIRTLKSLDTPGVTADQVHACLLPLIHAHEDLVSEMRRFLYQLAPLPRPDDIYEEVTLCSDNENEWDEFEEIVWLESPQSKITTTSLEAQNKPISLQSSSDKTNRTVASKQLIENHDLPAYENDQRVVLIDVTREQSTVHDFHEEQLHHPRSNKMTGEGLNASTRSWTRVEDKVILQKCWRPGQGKQSEESSVFVEIANHLQNRTASEIKSRFEDLQKLFDSVKS